MMDDDVLKVYGDIIDLPRPFSPTRKKMNNSARAAQFAPFAALASYDTVLQETARITEQMPELNDDQKFLINEQLVLIQQQITKKPIINISYFQPDALKDGGTIITQQAVVTKISLVYRKIYFQDKNSVLMDYILSLELIETSLNNE